MSDGWDAGHGWGRPTEQIVSGPDWASMAEQHEQAQKRRKQLRIVGIAAVATLAVGGITATAVLAAGSGRNGSAKVALDGPSPSATGSPSTPGTTPSSDASSVSPSASASAKPGTSGKPSPKASASPVATTPPDPLTAISSATTDTAPLDPNTLFAAKSLTVGGKTWTRITDATTTPCWQATTGHLGDAVVPQNCHSILRATYTSGSSAVTIGVAVFDTKAQADAADAAYKGQVQGLVTQGSTSFCTNPGCANSHSAIGRYTVYTVSGTVKPGGNAQDATATTAAPNFAAYARAQLLARGGHG